MLLIDGTEWYVGLSGGGAVPLIAWPSWAIKLGSRPNQWPDQNVNHGKRDVANVVKSFQAWRPCLCLPDYASKRGIAPVRVRMWRLGYLLWWWRHERSQVGALLQGFHASWKVMEFKTGIFQPWIVVENDCGHGIPPVGHVIFNRRIVILEV